MVLKNELCLHVGDVLLVVFVIYPSMVFYWRGIWDLWGVYINPLPYPAAKWGLVAFTIGFTFCAYFLSPVYQKYVVTGSSPVSYFIKTRAFMHVYGAFYMGFWRTWWETMDASFPDFDAVSSAVFWICAYTPLLLIRASRTTIFPPLFVAMDTRLGVLSPSTRFHTQPYSERYFLDCMLTHFLIIGLTVATWRGLWNFLVENMCAFTRPYSERYFLDCLLTHFLIMGLTVATWRGLWNLLIAVISPDDIAYGDHLCLAVGVPLMLVIFALEKPLRWGSVAAERKGFWAKVVYEDIMYTLILVSHGVLWRGAWNNMVRYVLPDPELGGWVCYAVGVVALTVTQNLGYVATIGCAVDGEDTGGDAFFPIRYLRHYLIDCKAQGSVRPRDDTETGQDIKNAKEDQENIGNKDTISTISNPTDRLSTPQ